MAKSKFTNVALVVGDWSYDGHNMTDTINIKVNCPTKELEAAFKAGVAKLGFDPTADFKPYEASSFSQETWDKMIAYFGDKVFAKEVFNNEDWTDIAKEAPIDWSLEPESYVNLWLLVAKTGKPDLVVKLAKATDSINVGGYGLFSN